jgi:hypothetical protein
MNTIAYIKPKLWGLSNLFFGFGEFYDGFTDYWIWQQEILMCNIK